MRIAIFNSLYYPDIKGGAEISVKVLAESLEQLGHEVFVITTAEKGGYRPIRGVHAVYLPANNLYAWKTSRTKPLLLKALWHLLDFFNLFLILRVWQVIRRLKPEVIHVNSLVGLSVAPWIVGKAHKIPVVHTLRDYQLLCIMQGSMFRNGAVCRRQCLRCRLLTGQKKWLSNHGYVQKVVGISRSTLDTHKRNGMFRGVGAERIFNSVPARSSTRSGPHHSQDGSLCPPGEERKTRLLFLGSVMAKKGIDTVLYLARTQSDLEITVAGELVEAHYRHAFEKWRINYLGFIDPEKEIARADYVIVPSLWEEPFSRAIIEAYAHGKPVIVSNRGGMPELVEDGATGFIFDADDLMSLDAIVAKIQGNKRPGEKMRQEMSRKLEQFDPQTVAEQYVAAYESVVQQ